MKYIYLLFISSLLVVNSITYAADNFLGRSNLTLKGEVTVATCGISDHESEKYVKLGHYSTKQLFRTGDKSPAVPIAFRMVRCLPGVPVTVKFIGVQDENNTEFLALNNVANSATNVAIEILNADRSRLPINSKSKQLTADKEGNIFTNFYANYVVTRDSPTAGFANSTAQFTIQYD